MFTPVMQPPCKTERKAHLNQRQLSRSSPASFDHLNDVIHLHRPMKHRRTDLTLGLLYKAVAAQMESPQPLEDA